MYRISPRRAFIKKATFAGLGITLADGFLPLSANTIRNSVENKKIGIIGLDTSHSVAFTKALNAPDAGTEYGGYKIVAAYPKGSNDIQSSVERIAGYTDEVKRSGVEIVDSIQDLLNMVDVVLLETNDGRLHLEQALLVFQAGKPMFIDKPVAASLVDAIAIYEAAERYKVPVFSSSSLRFAPTVQDAVQGTKTGKVLGADAYSPLKFEKTHPDLFWYGIHGVEILYAVMGTGCKQVSRIHSNENDVVVGVWEDNRIGTFRGIQAGKQAYGGTVFGEKSIATVGPHVGYNPLLLKIIEFFQTGISPVNAKDTLEICAFMEAADESKINNGAPVTIASMFEKAKKAKK